MTALFVTLTHAAFYGNTPISNKTKNHVKKSDCGKTRTLLPTSKVKTSKQGYFVLLTTKILIPTGYFDNV
jgi:hypothetical protein